MTEPGRARLSFPGFVLGVEKRSRNLIGCPPDRGLDTSLAPKVVRDQIRRTFHETPLARECLFVTHIAEFVPTDDPGSFAPVLRYDAYREDSPPEPGDVFAAGRTATLELRRRLGAVAAERAAAGRPVSHLIVFITGWHTPQLKTLKQMDELYGTLAAADDPAFSPILVGVSWPSFSDEIAGHVQKGTRLVTALAEGRLDRDRDDDAPRGGARSRVADKLDRVVGDLRVADKLGYLGYPAVSKDADEVGMVPVSTLVNQVLIPLRDTLPGRPPVVVIGHSFGARAASWTPFTAGLLPAVAGVADTAGPDLVIGLQAAFPAARFDATVVHHRPYVEGAAFADRGALRTAFAYTCARDIVLRPARVFDVMIGDSRAYERARRWRRGLRDLRGRRPPRRRGRRDPAPGKVLLIDAHTIIKGHDDVRNEKVGRLLRTLMGRIGPR